MADFVQTSNTKTAIRDLIVPIADVTTFNTLVAGVISGNPWLCTAYTLGDVPQDPVQKSKESYTARVVYEDEEAKAVGLITAKSKTIAGFNANLTEILANAELATAMGGDAVRDSGSETYSVTLKCHDANSEIYYVSFTRDRVTVSSYEDDAIRTRIETWADTKTELA